MVSRQCPNCKTAYPNTLFQKKYIKKETNGWCLHCIKSHRSYRTYSKRPMIERTAWRMTCLNCDDFHIRWSTTLAAGCCECPSCGSDKVFVKKLFKERENHPSDLWIKE